MVGMGSIVTRHVPPFALTFGSPAKPHGCNRVGMQRQGYEDSVIDSLDESLKVYSASNFDDYHTLIPKELHSIFNEWVAAVAKVRD
jgi:UDP-N-acetylglucosamine acyltransferase